MHWRQGDLLTAAGIDAAVDGVDVIVNCATQPTGDKDVTSIENLIAAARRAGVGHIVHVSIVGIDRIPLPYYKTKLRVERALEASGIGHTVLRATQFHELIETIFSIQRFSPGCGPSRVRFQPIDTRDVAARLVPWPMPNRPEGSPTSVAPPCTPHAIWHGCFSRRAKPSRGDSVPVPGRIVAGYRSGANLSPDNAVGVIGFEDYLAEAN